MLRLVPRSNQALQSQMTHFEVNEVRRTFLSWSDVGRTCYIDWQEETLINMVVISNTRCGTLNRLPQDLVVSLLQGALKYRLNRHLAKNYVGGVVLALNFKAIWLNPSGLAQGLGQLWGTLSLMNCLKLEGSSGLLYPNSIEQILDTHSQGYCIFSWETGLRCLLYF